jgi:hypothetical protein
MRRKSFEDYLAAIREDERGHPLVGENVRMERNSQRCRTCAREAMARFKERRAFSA